MIAIRLARPQELDRLMELEALTFPPAEAAPRETFAYRLAHMGEWFFVALDGERVVGLLNGRLTELDVIRDELYEPAPMTEGEYFALLCVETEPAWQRRGVAAALIGALLDRCRALGLRGVALACKQALRPYYESFGFRPVGVSASVHGGAVWYDMRLEL